jgi:hypothetical protein
VDKLQLGTRVSTVVMVRTVTGTLARPERLILGPAPWWSPAAQFPETDATKGVTAYLQPVDGTDLWAAGLLTGAENQWNSAAVRR